jgi:hypothetical protein
MDLRMFRQCSFEDLLALAPPSQYNLWYPNTYQTQSEVFAVEHLALARGCLPAGTSAVVWGGRGCCCGRSQFLCLTNSPVQ